MHLVEVMALYWICTKHFAHCIFVLFNIYISIYTFIQIYCSFIQLLSIGRCCGSHSAPPGNDGHKMRWVLIKHWIQVIQGNVYYVVLQEYVSAWNNFSLVSLPVAVCFLRGQTPLFGAWSIRGRCIFISSHHPWKYCDLLPGLIWEDHWLPCPLSAGHVWLASQKTPHHLDRSSLDLRTLMYLQCGILSTPL